MTWYGCIEEQTTSLQRLDHMKYCCRPPARHLQQLLRPCRHTHTTQALAQGFSRCLLQFSAKGCTTALSSLAARGQKATMWPSSSWQASSQAAFVVFYAPSLKVSRFVTTGSEECRKNAIQCNAPTTGHDCAFKHAVQAHWGLFVQSSSRLNLALHFVLHGLRPAHRHVENGSQCRNGEHVPTRK